MEAERNLQAREYGHSWCMLCGEMNPRSLRLRFREEEGVVSAEFEPDWELQGYDGVVHGGMVSAFLDAAMTHCLFIRGIRAMTGDLHVRFLHLVKIGEGTRVKAWLHQSRPPLYQLRAELYQVGVVMARAEAKFMKQESPK